MVRCRITDEDENNMMYSTDEDDQSNMENMPLKESIYQDNKNQPLLEKSEMILNDITSGPYQVDFKKRYKPIFVCFIDLIFGYSFMMGSLYYYWSQIPDEYSFADYRGFVPGYMIYQ